MEIKDELLAVFELQTGQIVMRVILSSGRSWE